MATYYGQCKGNGTATTRTGTKASGIRASVQSWNGSVITSMCNGIIAIEISKNSSFSGKTVFYGTLEELENKLTGEK